MNLNEFIFPPVFKQVGQLLPRRISSLPLLLGLEFARRSQLLIAPEILFGKRFTLEVLDLGVSAHLYCNQGKFQAWLPAQSTQLADVKLAANAADLLQLAAGVADADTLFFRRRLKMQGDTEAGVALKYWLDSSQRPDWLSRLGQQLFN